VLPNADGIGILVAMVEFAICVLLIAGLFTQVVGAHRDDPRRRAGAALDAGGLRQGLSASRAAPCGL